MNPFEKFEKNLQSNQASRTQIEERLRYIDSLEGNEAALKEELKKMGVDLSSVNLDKSTLINIVESIKSQSELLGKAMFNEDNPKSAGLMNFLTKINEHGFDREKDGKTMIHLANTYFEEEQKIKAERCFHPEQQQCKGGIIGAHSLQRKGPLHRIAVQENNKFQVIHFNRDLISNTWKAESIQTKYASIFRGFCKHHDDLFAENIETIPYEGTSKQKFLHSYRSFAYSYHKRLEHYSPIESLDDLADNASGILGNFSDLFGMLGALKPGAIIPSIDTMRVSDENKASRNADQFEDHKVELNNMILQERYDDLEYITFELEHICPIICASIVKMHAEIADIFVIENKGKIYNGSPIILTIVHTPRNTSLILLARFKSDAVTGIIFQQLAAMSPAELGRRITTLIFEQVENFYLAPSFWNYLPQMEKDKITNGLARKKEQFPYKSTFEVSINIFDKIHTIS